MSITPGSTLGPYEIVAPIGAGGMGEVWKARDPRIGREVAIKVLPSEMLADRARLGRFEKEARAAGGLNHPNLLTIHDVGEDRGIPYIVMELLDGETLEERLVSRHDSQSSVKVSARRALDWGCQIANGLAAAHEAGIVHRDLKPANLFLTRDGRVKILDFGLAKMSLHEADAEAPTLAKQTDPGVVMGTVAYMSPEQVRGQTVDQRSDIFSFGMILYEILTGDRAFKGATKADLMTAILKEDPAPIESVAPHVQAPLARIVEHCLEKNREQRFQSARDIAFNLDSIAGSSGSAAARSAGLAMWRPSLRIAALLLGLVAVFALGIWVGRRSAPRGVATHAAAVKPVLTRAITFSGADDSPAFSPDGSLVAFVSSRDGKSRIWVKQLKGGGELALTSGPDSMPRFSPDGSAILFTRDAGQSRFSIYRVATLGGEPRKVIDDGATADWSPDGGEIAFVRLHVENGQYDSSLLVARADGSQEKEILHKTSYLANPRWSPDGTRIVVNEELSAGSVMGPWIVDRHGEHSVRIAGTASFWSNVAWIDDHRLVSAIIQTGGGIAAGAGSIFNLVDVPTGAATPLFHVIAPVTSIDVDRDGRIAFDAMPVRLNLREIDVASGRTIRWLTRGEAIDRQPAFSPDGLRVIFSSNMTGNLDLSMAALDDRSLGRLTDDPADDVDPAFTPDGKRILWSSTREVGHFEIWSASADGSGAHRVSNDGLDAENPTSTPDGKWVVYTSYNPAKAGIWKIQLDGTGARQIVSGSSQLPEVSPDGRWISFVDGGDWLSVVSIEGGPIQKLAPVAQQTVFTAASIMGRSRWLPDGRGIVYVGTDGAGNTVLLAQDFKPGVDTSKTRRTYLGTSPDGEPESFGLSTDGRTIVASYWTRLSSIRVSDPIAELTRAPSGK